MRLAVILFLITSLSAQDLIASKDGVGDDPGPVVKVKGTTSLGLPLSYSSAYVEGDEAPEAIEGAIRAVEESPGEKHIVVSTDDPNNEIYNKVKPEIDKFSDVPKFLLLEGGSQNNVVENGYEFLRDKSDLIKERSLETYSSLKEDKPGVLVFLMMTAMNTTLYMHFVQHPGFISVGVPVLLTLLGNVIYWDSNIFKPFKKPIDNIKGRIETLKTVAKEGEAKIGEKLGINTDTNKFKNFQEISLAFGIYAASTFLFTALTSHGFTIPNIHSTIYLDAIFNGLSNAPLLAMARKWKEDGNPPLTKKGIDWVMRSNRFALALIFPDFYVMRNMIGYIGVSVVGAIGWYVFFRGDEFIPAVKENIYFKNSVQAFKDIYDAFNEEYLPSAKQALKDKAAICNYWFKSLKK